jgi:type IV pilus assembly protein PilY1
MKTKTQTTVLATALGLLLAAGTAHAAASLTIGAGIGSVKLGVQDFGNLNMGSGITKNGGTNSGSPGYAAGSVGPGSLGLAIFLDGVGDPSARGAGYYDSTSPGCLCEGWGVSASGAGAGADVDVGGNANLTLDSFTSSATNLVSKVHMTAGGLSVTQDYHVALGGASTSTFEDTVTITNTTGGTLTNVTYRRVMDWDVPYTEFSEAVTIQGWPATNLVQSGDDGFDNPNPLTAAHSIACPMNTNFTDCSPSSDHGALFDFNFGSLAAGASKTFKIFYGATLNERTALAALGAVGAEVYSLGQSDGPHAPGDPGDPVAGTPATYFFGFAGVGGTPLVPEPSSMLLFGAPVLFAIGSLRKKFRKV